MALATLNPTREELQKFGPLAYVSMAERSRMISLPAGQYHRALTNLEREIAVAKRKGRI